MPLGTGRTGLSGPSTPLSFATLADLSAAVAANGGQPLDGTLQARVGDALYVWDASIGAYVLVGSPTRLDRPIRIATYGSSLANAVASCNAFDAENTLYPIPGTGSASAMIVATACPIVGSRRVLYVANGGISGQTTTDMIYRNKNTPSTSRKAVTDIISKHPDVVLLQAGGINEFSHVPAGSDVNAIASASLTQHLKIVRMFTSRGIPVIDMGNYGYSGGAAGDTATVQAIIVAFNTACEIAARSDKNHHYWNPEGILGEAGGYFAGVSIDGVHLSAYGAHLAKNKQVEILDKLFLSKVNYGAVLFDGHYAWGNPLSGLPANHTYNGATLTNKACDTEVFSAEMNMSSLGLYGLFVYSDLKTALGSLSASDKVSVDIHVGVFDSNGNPVDFELTSRLKVYNAGNTASITQGFAYGYANGETEATAQMVMPDSGTNIGSSSEFSSTITPKVTGMLTLKIWPTMIYARP